MNVKESSSYQNFLRALRSLEQAVATPVVEPRDLGGILKLFELTYELSWKVLKRKLREQGHETQGAKDVFTQAFRLGYLKDESLWLEMIVDRIASVHFYDEKDAITVKDHILSKYLDAFKELVKVFDQQ